MRLTTETLKHIIKEEIRKLLNEAAWWQNSLKIDKGYDGSIIDYALEQPSISGFSTSIGYLTTREGRISGPHAPKIGTSTAAWEDFIDPEIAKANYAHIDDIPKTYKELLEMTPLLRKGDKKVIKRLMVKLSNEENLTPAENIAKRYFNGVFNQMSKDMKK